MAKDLFYSLDLNLLRTFLVLSQELNMRKASERLFVSQPAISQSLQKLRNHFNDELFVKVRTGLQATPFSEELASAVTPHLDGLSNALNDTQEFIPSILDRKITIALSPIVLACLSGTLYHKIRELAPNAMLELVSWSHSTSEDIRKGKVLVGVNYELDQNKEIFNQYLMDLTGKVIVRQDHPIKQLVATPYDFEGYEIASVITPGWNDTFSTAGQIMERLNLKYSIGFRSEVIMAVIDVITHTDMYMPHSDLFPIKNYPSLRAIDIKIDGASHHYPVYSHFHIKNKHSPMLQWLNGIIQNALIEQIETNKHSL